MPDPDESAHDDNGCRGHEDPNEKINHPDPLTVSRRRSTSLAPACERSQTPVLDASRARVVRAHPIEPAPTPHPCRDEVPVALPPTRGREGRPPRHSGTGSRPPPRGSRSLG